MTRLFEMLKAKLVLLVSKAVINLVTDSESIQLVQVDLGNDEVIDSVERIQNFGFTSHPKSGAKAIVLCVSGEREHPIVIVADDNGDKRPELSSGEAAVYNAFSEIVKLKDGTIEIGQSAFVKLITEAFQSVFNNHGHDYVAPGGPAISGTPVQGIAPVSVPTPITNSEMTTVLKAE
jgi:phage gp45-like